MRDSEDGKADSRLAQGQQTALGLLREQLRRSTSGVSVVAGDEQMAAALRAGNRDAVLARGRVLMRRAQIIRLRVTRRGQTMVDLGTPLAIVPARRQLVSPQGERIATIEASKTTAGFYVRQINRFTSLDAVLSPRRQGPRQHCRQTVGPSGRAVRNH